MPVDFGRIIRSLHQQEVEFVVIGASAAIAQGAPIGTIDLDLGYRRSRINIQRLVAAIKPFHPRLRGVADAVPFRFSAQTLMRGCNFTFVTDAGDLDLLGHVTGLGDYDAMTASAIKLPMFGCPILVMDLDDVIKSKRAAGRPKDRAVLPVLEETARLRHSDDHRSIVQRLVSKVQHND